MRTKSEFSWESVFVGETEIVIFYYNEEGFEVCHLASDDCYRLIASEGWL